MIWDRTLLEMQRVADGSQRSWVVGNTVQKDSSLLFTTLTDPFVCAVANA